MPDKTTAVAKAKNEEEKVCNLMLASMRLQNEFNRAVKSYMTAFMTDLAEKRPDLTAVEINTSTEVSGQRKVVLRATYVPGHKYDDGNLFEDKTLNLCASFLTLAAMQIYGNDGKLWARLNQRWRAPTDDKPARGRRMSY